MKKLLVIAALTAAAAPAMASQARIQSLGNSRHLVDFQTAFSRPYQFMALGSMATIEWGSADTTAAPPGGGVTTPTRHAEGGFLMKHDEYAYGAYLGRRAASFSTVIANGGATFANALREQNPINLYYASKMGDWTWGVTGKYSNGKTEVPAADLSATSSGIALGASNGTFDIDVEQGITGKTEVGADSLESKGSTNIVLGYHIDPNMEAYVSYGMLKADSTVGGATTTTTDIQSMSVGFVNTVSATEDASFFYGIAYNNVKSENRFETMHLPVWMGIEANATSWMVMRAFVRQNIILNETKIIPVANAKQDTDSIAFGAGAGFRLGKGMLDASFGTADQGHLSFSDGSAGNQFLSNVAYTYMF